MSPTPESDRWDAGTNQVGRNVGPPHAAVLRGRYDEYCRQQVTLLLEIVPREALRTLYRSARSWATREGLHESKDPMSTLRAFCRELLPLPPFEIWLSDFEHHRLAHLSAGAELSPLTQTLEPIVVTSKRIEYRAEWWRGALEVYRRGDAWRGIIRFQRKGEGEHFRTGEIFREDELQDLRDRFNSFTALTLSAFLRSTLP